MNNKPDYYNDLEKTYSKIWDLLKNGLDNRDAPFHIPVFVCGEIDKSKPRIVVLRGIDKGESKIWFHTDIRSDKIKILKTNPKASFLFYDKTEKVQLRISVISKINYQNDLTKKSWEKTAHMSRQCYLGEKAPGEISTSGPTSGLSESIDNLKYSIEESEEGYKNFCVVENFVKSIEWLYLAAKGHRRARFDLENNKDTWLVP
ncbi:MAG: flavin-binding protein [Candidatus Pelagibacter sp. TMED64]|nr:flavin-binding protein [Candidatus Pelagibacter sp.]OUU67513.1 MAG: flavin-binding protein [Candidatus Pelagibacter sp. TMED64]